MPEAMGFGLLPPELIVRVLLSDSLSARDLVGISLASRRAWRPTQEAHTTPLEAPAGYKCPAFRLPSDAVHLQTPRPLPAADSLQTLLGMGAAEFCASIMVSHIFGTRSLKLLPSESYINCLAWLERVQHMPRAVVATSGNETVVSGVVRSAAEPRSSLSTF